MGVTHWCSVDEVLVSQCRVWLGARSGGFSGVRPDFAVQHSCFETLVDGRLDLVYHHAGVRNVPLSDAKVRGWADRVETWLVQGWEPVKLWGDVLSGGRGVWGRVDRVIDRVAALAPKEIFVVVHPGADRVVGVAGTGVEYCRMVEALRGRFESRGVVNVLWGVGSLDMGLWPGRGVVDWAWLLSGVGVDVGGVVSGFGGGVPVGVIDQGVSGSGLGVVRGYYQGAGVLLAGGLGVSAWVVDALCGGELELEDGGRVWKDFCGHSRFNCLLWRLVVSGVKRCGSAVPQICGLLVGDGGGYCRRYLQHGGDHAVSFVDAVRMDTADPRAVNVGVDESAVFFKSPSLEDLLRDMLGHLVLDQRTMMLGMVIRQSDGVEFSQVLSDDSADNRVLFSIWKQFNAGLDFGVEFPAEMVETGVMGWMLVVDAVGEENSVSAESFRVASFIGAAGIVWQRVWQGVEISDHIVDSGVSYEVLRGFYRASYDQLWSSS